MKNGIRTLAPQLLIYFALTLAAPLSAHEFWISPVNYVISPQGQVQADIRVGQNFNGPAYSYQERLFERFDVVTNTGLIPVEGRTGDVPAMSFDALPEGLAIIVHETGDNRLTYKEWAKFKKFVDHKDMQGVLDTHLERGIPQEDFRELYRRYAKSLVAIGNGEGSDQRVGLRTEIVALKNPYSGPISEMEVEVLLEGEPRKQAQIELFVKDPNGDVTIELYRTDDLGRGKFPVQSGHEYLVDAVAMEPLENDDPEKGPVWISLWAALTFLVP